jgi:hypothetical protein
LELAGWEVRGIGWVEWFEKEGLELIFMNWKNEFKEGRESIGSWCEDNVNEVEERRYCWC